MKATAFPALLLAALLAAGCAAPEGAAETAVPQTAAETPRQVLTNQPGQAADRVILPAEGRRKALTQRDLNRWMELSLNVMLMAEANYVEEVERETLMRNALNGMLSSLDPFSEFYTPEDFKILNTVTSGEFGGIGVEIMANPGGGAVIMAPIEGTPAYEAGLLPFDQLKAIDGQDISRSDMMTMTRLLRGEVGTPVSVTVSRSESGSRKDYTFSMKRGRISVPSIPEAVMLEGEDGIGYVRIATFDQNMVTNLAAEVAGLQSRGLKALVIDLRDNGGGLLTAACQAAELFVPKDSLVVSTKGRVVPEQKLVSKKDPVCTVPLAVLVNGFTASASEILSAALRYHCDAPLVGSKTFGKGSVQNVSNVGTNGFGMKMTIARYYTPEGVCIHKKGLEPDLEIRLSEDEMKELREERQKSRAARYEAREKGETIGTRPVGPRDRVLKAAVTLLNRQAGKTKEN